MVLDDEYFYIPFVAEAAFALIFILVVYIFLANKVMYKWPHL